MSFNLNFGTEYSQNEIQNQPTIDIENSNYNNENLRLPISEKRSQLCQSSNSSSIPQSQSTNQFQDNSFYIAGLNSSNEFQGSTNVSQQNSTSSSSSRRQFQKKSSGLYESVLRAIKRMKNPDNLIQGTNYQQQLIEMAIAEKDFPYNLLINSIEDKQSFQDNFEYLLEFRRKQKLRGLTNEPSAGLLDHAANNLRNKMMIKHKKINLKY